MPADCRFTAAIAFLVVSTAASCADPDAGAGSQPGGDVESDAPADVGTLHDGSGEDGEDGDAGDADAETSEAGEPCNDDDDCDGLVCVDVVVGAEQGICSQYCEEDRDCEPGFDCVLILNSGGDAVSVCLPTDLCIDEDGDRYGVGPGCLGEDCDDETELSSPVADEVCDNIDNDCDLDVDDNTVNENDDCDTGLLGVCAVGRIRCADGIEECVGGATPAEELCDTVDNDCDGAVDEGSGGEALERTCYDGAEGTLGVGACVAGVQTCVGGGFTGCLRQVIPGDETCDGVDNDCDGEVDEGFTTQLYWPDADGDGFGDPDGEPVEACATPAGYAGNDDDCNDAESTVSGGADEVVGDGVDQDCDGVETCWVDGDGDGYHDGLTIASVGLSCDGDGLGDASLLPGDCNDSAEAVNPGAEDAIGDEIDQDCDGIELCYVDADNDGYRLGETVESINESCRNNGEAQDFEPDGDCNDGDAAINPGADEICDGFDNNCDESVDNGGTDGRYWIDADGDGYGDADAEPVADCELRDGFADNDRDCDDGDERVNPGRPEIIADGIDQDCDGAEVCRVDADGDGYRPTPTATVDSNDLDCIDRGEAAADAPVGDCDDAQPARNDGAAEICDQIDNDCDNLVDGADPDFDGLNGTFWPDLDFDGFGDGDATPVTTCSPPSGWVTNPLDCNDDARSINPTATEGIADGIDQDCDGVELCFVDRDSDGFRARTGTVESLNLACTDPGEADATFAFGDCNDEAPLIYPGAEEIVGNEIDENCDTAELCFEDADGDGWIVSRDDVLVSSDLFCDAVGEGDGTSRVGDCAPLDGDAYPGATENPGDGIDQNCDGGELCYQDIDGDDYGSTLQIASTDVDCDDTNEAWSRPEPADCNDLETAINPGATEVCDGIDNDCDRLVDGDDPQIPDGDGDGVDACSDCDDENAGITNVLVVTGGGVGSIIEGDIFGDGITTATAVIAQSIAITDLNVLVNINHGWNSDIAIRLRGPDGTTVSLSFRRGGNGDNYRNTIFDDEAATPIGSGTPPFTGSFRPESPLSAFDGRNTSGTWTLEIQDYISDQDGVLNGWELRFGLDCSP